MQAQAGFTVLPNYGFGDAPGMDAFLIPGGFGPRQEMYNGRLHEFIRALPEKTLLTSVCTGSWVYARMGLLDGRAATNRKEPDRLEASGMGKVPIERLAEIAPGAGESRPRGRQRTLHHAPAASPPGWRWDFTCCAAPAMTKRSSPTSPG